MPPAASFQKPCFLPSAPVNAPFSCPNSAEAASSLDSRPQSKDTKVPDARLFLTWIFSAMCSLSVPLSLNIRTLMFVGATNLILRKPRSDARERAYFSDPSSSARFSGAERGCPQSTFWGYSPLRQASLTSQW